MKKGCGLMRAFVPGKGGERFGAAKSMENMGSLVGIILLSHCLGTSVDFAAPNLYPPLPGTKALMSPHPFFMLHPFLILQRDFSKMQMESHHSLPA